MPSADKIISTIMPYILGGIAGFGSAFLPGFAKEFFDERARRFKHKLHVSRHVLGICNEASTGNFRKPPRDMEHVNGTLTNLDGIDTEIGAVMNSFVNLWGRLVEQSEELEQNKDKSKFYIEMLNEIEKKRKILVIWANKIRVGS